jgi:hypothetical protein
VASQVARNQNRYVGGPNPSGLADVLDIILDKGLVIDLYVRVSLVGVELITIDARIVVASVDTYLRFAEAVGRMDLREEDDSASLPDMVEGVASGASKTKAKGALDAASDKFDELFGSDEGDEEEEPEEEEPRRERAPARRRKRAAKGEEA